MDDTVYVLLSDLVLSGFTPVTPPPPLLCCNDPRSSCRFTSVFTELQSVWVGLLVLVLDSIYFLE